MKYHTPLITAALLVSPFTGCSKHPSPPAANPGNVDYGVLEVSSSGTTSSHDIDLGDGNFFVIKSFVVSEQTGSQMVVSSAEVRMRGGNAPLITFDARTNLPGKATFFSNGRYTIKFEPHVKP
jgi:hypothetical protein